MYPVKTRFKVSPLSDALWSEVLWIFCAVDKSLLSGKDKVRFRESQANLWMLFSYICGSPTPLSIYTHTSVHISKHSVHKDAIKGRKVQKHNKIQIHTEFGTSILFPQWSAGELWIAEEGKEMYSESERDSIWFEGGGAVWYKTPPTSNTPQLIGSQTEKN